MSLLDELNQGLQQANISLKQQQCEQLIEYLALISKWNKVHNLTAIRDQQDMLTLHILDSVVVLPFVAQAKNLLDVGSGAGLPGIVLAICQPDLQVSVIDANQKKVSFMRQVKAELNLANLTVLSGRVEAVHTAGPFEIIISRAFSDLNTFVSLTQSLIAKHGKWLAMKGQIPHQEMQALQQSMQLQPISLHKLVVPGLAAERHLLIFNHDA